MDGGLAPVRGQRRAGPGCRKGSAPTAKPHYPKAMIYVTLILPYESLIKGISEVGPLPDKVVTLRSCGLSDLFCRSLIFPPLAAPRDLAPASGPSWGRPRPAPYPYLYLSGVLPWTSGSKPLPWNLLASGGIALGHGHHQGRAVLEGHDLGEAAQPQGLGPQQGGLVLVMQGARP